MSHNTDNSEPVSHESLHGRIMNLPQTPGLPMVNATEAQLLAYKIGHRDARHAAAELALKADAELDALRAAVPVEPAQQWVAVPGAVWEDGGVSLIRRGAEDERCKTRGSERLYRPATPATPLQKKETP